MKIYLIGFGLVFVGFCLGVLIAALCCAAGRAKAVNKVIEAEDVKQIKYLHDLIHGKSEGGDT